jgi:NADH dehydrogenase
LSKLADPDSITIARKLIAPSIVNHKNILVLGGSGFIGRHLVARLVAHGCRVLVPARRRDRAKHLILLPTVEVVDADVFDPPTLARLLAGQDAVVNLIGVLHATPAEFQRVHVDFVRQVMEAAAKAKVRRVLAMSALGADRNGPSIYARSRGDGEAVVRQSLADWTIYQPSIVFGPEDRFLNLFAELAAIAPVLPIGGADTKFQPIYVGDVVSAMVNTLDNETSHRKTYELCGPEIFSLRELVAFAARAAGHPRAVPALPDKLARAQAWLMERVPGPTLLSRDNLDSLKRDNIASTQPYRPAPELGIAPVPMKAEATRYLARSKTTSHYSGWRSRAGR